MEKIFEIINERKRYFDKESLSIKSVEKEEVAASLIKTEEHSLNVIKCPNCNELLDYLELSINNGVCYYCNHHFRLNSIERISSIFDDGSIEFFDENISSCNHLGFPNYDEKLLFLKETLKINEAVLTGKGNILNEEVYFGVMDYRFIMGSMGSVVGEKLTRMIEKATNQNKPIIIFSASGGARMQEGMLSLYQMAKVISAIEKHSEKNLLYISVLTDPTTGGVIASFASVADIIIAEPNATIGFAGKRVIKSTTNEKIPDNFQTSEFHLENGHIDIICDRSKLKSTILNLIKLYVTNIIDKYEELEYLTEEIVKLSDSKKLSISEWDRVMIARDSDRPKCNQYISNIFDNFMELRGDRISDDDRAVTTGIGYIKGIPVTAIFNSKGNTLEENILNNFGMSNPSGYRKIIRVSKLAEKFRMPVICFIDTPGAGCGVEAEKMGQSYAIASSIRNFTRIKVPIISIITGEGGSGGALAMGVADWVYILENSIYSVISPEGCASILFKDTSKVEECCKYLNLTSDQLLSLRIVDEIIPEFREESNLYGEKFFMNLRSNLYNKLVELLKFDTDLLLNNRYHRFRNQGVYEEI